MRTGIQERDSDGKNREWVRSLFIRRWPMKPDGGYWLEGMTQKNKMNFCKQNATVEYVAFFSSVSGHFYQLIKVAPTARRHPERKRRICCRNEEDGNYILFYDLSHCGKRVPFTTNVVHRIHGNSWCRIGKKGANLIRSKSKLARIEIINNLCYNIYVMLVKKEFYAMVHATGFV